MTHAPWLLLHTGHEVTFGVYLYRVLVYLMAFGGIAGLTYWLAGAVEPSQSRSEAALGSQEDER